VSRNSSVDRVSGRRVSGRMVSGPMVSKATQIELEKTPLDK